MEDGEGIMMRHETEGLSLSAAAYAIRSDEQHAAAADSAATADDASQPALIQFSSTPLFRLERCCDKYAHLLKKKDINHIGPLVSYLICNSGHVIYLGGDVVRNLYLNGRRRYKTINILGILPADDIEKYSDIMNNVISSNDGAFSLGVKYRVRKNRAEGCFRAAAQVRYVIEPRLEGLELLLFPFRPAAIELDLTTQARFSSVYGIQVR